MRQDVSFKTSDNVTLRGWFYRPDNAAGQLACLVMAHGFSALKEMNLDTFAEHFISALPICCLVYDNRGFGNSDTGPSQPRQEIIPWQQHSDYSDAITYAQSRHDVDNGKIGIWGSSYSGGHVLWVAAVDRRVKVVLSQVPCVNGWDSFHRLIRPDLVAGLNQLFQDDRHGRAQGKAAGVLPVVEQGMHKPSALHTPDSYAYFTGWEKRCGWKNEVTIKSIEAFREYNPSTHIHHISPTPLLMTVAENDVLTPADLALEAYSRALEPKQLHIVPGGHFDCYSGYSFERNSQYQVDFLKKHLCSQPDKREEAAQDA
ncbi:Esterase/lipase [Metarhizium guizhouense ARSEF 977]|uniref:Esterase/lipase n=1 Tax=Metarhizium guizhouense (strain ARSEF 977) TaxID=1276136 RepID=A0A0B4H1K2_METGA|nr:Esterase/lipase [Metarhizium guizhouense ARSEF 977]